MNNNSFFVIPKRDIFPLLPHSNSSSLLDKEADHFGFLTSHNISNFELKSTSLCLLSNLPLKIEADDAWMKGVENVLRTVKASSNTLISSYGKTNWNYITWRANVLEIPLIIVTLPMKPDECSVQFENVIIDLGLDRNTTKFIVPLVEGKLKPESLYRIRDITTLALSNSRYIASLKNNSRWQKPLSNLQNVNTDHAETYPQAKRFTYSIDKLNPRLNDLVGENLIHWTRGTYGKWFGENNVSYFQALSTSKSGNPRDAFATLCKIIDERLLRGSAILNKSHESVISFSNAPPVQIVSKIKFRTPLKRPVFEPYGIAINRDVLDKLGVKPVFYGTLKQYAELNIDEQPFFQNEGNANLSVYHFEQGWRPESEWRHIGDLDFRHLDEHLTVIVKTKDESELIAKRYNLKCLAIVE